MAVLSENEVSQVECWKERLPPRIPSITNASHVRNIVEVLQCEQADRPHRETHPAAHLGVSDSVAYNAVPHPTPHNSLCKEDESVARILVHNLPPEPVLATPQRARRERLLQQQNDGQQEVADCETEYVCVLRVVWEDEVVLEVEETAPRRDDEGGNEKVREKAVEEVVL